MSEDQEQPKNFYHSLNEEKNDNLKGYSEAMDKTKHSVAGFYSNVEDNTSVRPPFARKHYERFRPGEAIPNDDSEIMLSCREAYEKVGLIRSVVDLMTEIAIDGISIVSTNDSTEKFFKSWAKKVNLEELAEKFANYFIVEGNVSVRRKLDTIDVPSVRRMKREPAVGQELDESQIPMEYIFYDPSTLELIGGELAIFAGVRRWGLKVSGSEVSNLRQLATEGNKDLLKSLPKEVRSLLTGKNSSMAGYKSEVVIPIPEDQIYVAHYKKKDSDIWAKSFIYSILHDVIYNEKLRMAKISALDSWYNSVRLWKLGDHKEEILPDVGSVTKLANILENHTGGTMDIIWDSMLSFEQFFPPVEKLQNFDENYESMLLGLGIHKSLIGGDETAAAASSAFMGLRNVMKRIDAVRRALSSWINSEIDIIVDELGFRNRPTVKFKNDDLFEQGSYFRLLMDLNDRSIISNRTIVEKIGEMWEIENGRISSEEMSREAGDTPPKYSPYIQSYVPEENHDKQMELKETSVPKSPYTNTDEEGKDSGLNQGRPPGSKDSFKRKRTIKTVAELIVVGERIQDKLDKICDADYLKEKGIKNKRMLTSDQRQELEDIKLGVMSIVKDDKFSSVRGLTGHINEDFIRVYTDMVKQVGSDLTHSEYRAIKSSAFAQVNGQSPVEENQVQ
jgi:hypothetical protein